MAIEFVDGLADVMITGGVARLDFFSLRPTGAKMERGQEGNALAPTPALTLAIPIEGLANAAKILDDVRKRLLQEGIIQERQQEAGGEPANRSPNFKLDS